MYRNGLRRNKRQTRQDGRRSVRQGGGFMILEICEDCNGHGVIWGNRSRGGDEECSACDGEGMTYVKRIKGGRIMTASIYVVERGFRDGVSENYHSEIIGVYADKSIANKVMTSEDD